MPRKRQPARWRFGAWFPDQPQRGHGLCNEDLHEHGEIGARKFSELIGCASGRFRSRRAFGGELFVAGSVLVTPTGSQPWVAATASGSAGDTVEVTDASGAVIASFEADQSFGAVFYSGPTVADGGSYTITVNGVTAVTVSEGVNVAGGGMGGGTGGGGGRRP